MDTLSEFVILYPLPQTHSHINFIACFILQKKNNLDYRRKMRFLQVSFTVVLWTSFLLSFIGYGLWLIFQVPSETDVRNATSVTTGSSLTTSLNLSCPPESVPYCLNGGTCYVPIDVDVLACLCQKDYGGKRCEKFLWYH